MGGLRTIEQRINAGEDFDGTVPLLDSKREGGMEQFDPADSGGVFDFKIKSPHFVRTIELRLGGQTSWTIHKRDIDGGETILFQGDDEEHVLMTERDSFVLDGSQLIVVRTTGATAPLLARVTIQTP
jgi:hypothetical protein